MLHPVVQKNIARLFFHNLRKRVRSLTPSEISRRQEVRLLNAFRKAVRRSPAYRDFLQTSGVDFKNIRTKQDFENHVPYLSKKTFFDRYATSYIFPNLLKNNTGRVWSTSGSTGQISIGYESPNMPILFSELDFTLNSFFEILDRKSLFLNCLSDAWPVPSSFLHFANIGSRVDLGIELIKKTSTDFKQFFICGEPLLLKLFLEEATSAGVNFHHTNFHMFIGGE